MTNATRRANPDFAAMVPNSVAPKTNHGVSVANPLKAVAKSTIPKAQKRKQPISPVVAYSMASVIHATMMNEETANACFASGATLIGPNQIKTGMTTLRTRPILARSEISDPCDSATDGVATWVLMWFLLRTEMK